jgi:predicted site-specific integrase-resolvase
MERIDPTEQEPTMSVQDIATAAHVSKNTVHRWIDAGLIEPADPFNPGLGRQPRFRFHAADVERLLARVRAGDIPHQKPGPKPRKS